MIFSNKISGASTSQKEGVPDVVVQNYRRKMKWAYLFSVVIVSAFAYGRVYVTALIERGGYPGEVFASVAGLIFYLGTFLGITYYSSLFFSKGTKPSRNIGKVIVDYLVGFVLVFFVMFIIARLLLLPTIFINIFLGEL